jgi:hypothetical protein
MGTKGLVSPKILGELQNYKFSTGASGPRRDGTRIRRSVVCRHERPLLVVAGELPADDSAAGKEQGC